MPRRCLEPGSHCVKSSQPSVPAAAPAAAPAFPADDAPRSGGRIRASALLLAAALTTGGAANAVETTIALGDSITFGETDLLYRTSFGDRGYVARFADALAATAGTRPDVINLAIDGETAASFMSGSGRPPPVAGRTDVPLALENLHDDAAALVPQGQLFAATVAAQQALGNSIGTVTITLGFNELGALAALPPADALAAIPATLAAYRANDSAVLGDVRNLLPAAQLFVLGYYNRSRPTREVRRRRSSMPPASS